MLQTGNWSNGLTFNVSTATISSISPTSGLPGTVVTVAGSGFGASRGSGQVWLGTARAAVASWSDTQIVAEVAIGSRSGNAQVLQSGVMSNAVPFLVNTPQITSVSPTSGPAGTTVTITGTGFGASQGSGTVVIGGVSAPVVSWNNTQIVVIVPGGALTGPLGVQQNSVPSNPVNFIVPSPSGNNVTIEPNVLNMLVGDTATIQAINSALQPVTGLAWASSNPNIVSLSTDDPPILTAVAVGHVTITSGNASADVTVWPSANAPGAPGGGLPLGTTIWSNPADAYKIVPAVPSSSGVADIFAFLNDFATVQAIKSDGTTAWSATLNGEAFFTAVPDFMGGLVVFNPAAYDDEGNLTSPGSIQRLDGITGQPYPAYVPTNYAPTSLLSVGPAVHPDGTVFAVRDNWLGSPPTETALAPTVVGIDPTSGAQKFNVPIKNNCSAPDSQIFVSDEAWQAGGFIIAGDGYAYLPHYCDDGIAPGLVIRRVSLMRINTNGESDDINIQSYVEQNSDFLGLEVHMITNADTGVLLSWISFSGAGDWTAITNGTGVSVSNGIIPGQDVQPVVQAQDGSFVGVYFTGSSYPQQPNMIAFDQSGNVRWIVPNDQPQIATADGGVIAQSGIIYDQNGNVTGQIANLPTYSWPGDAYRVGSVDQVPALTIFPVLNFWAFLGGSNSGAGTADDQQKFPELKSCKDKGGDCAQKLEPKDLLWNAKNDLVSQLSNNPSCSSAATTYLYNVVTYGGLGIFTHSVDGKLFVGYIAKTRHFYDGTKSTFDAKDLGVNGTFPPETVAQRFFGPGSDTTAVAAAGHDPLWTFWQPAKATQSDGYVGIDPTKFGMNLLNESNLLHEALHGFTALSDEAIQTLLHDVDPTVVVDPSDTSNITVYIQKWVLSACPISKR